MDKKHIDNGVWNHGKQIINCSLSLSDYLNVLLNEVIYNLDFYEEDELICAMKTRLQNYLTCMDMILKQDVCKTTKDSITAQWGAIIMHIGFDIMNYIAMKSGGIRSNPRRIIKLREHYMTKE